MSSPNNDSARTKRLKVLFMHGLESGPGGRKERYLRQHFEVCAPDMQISLYNLRKSNSVLRTALTRPLFLGWAAATLVTFVFAFLTRGPVVWLGVALVCGASLAAIRRSLEHQALSLSLERCVALQAEAVRTFCPDVVVGSSWGGAVALLCASRAICVGPMLVLAPVQDLIFDRLGNSAAARRDALRKGLASGIAQRILIVHGDQDETVPVAHSQSLSEATGVRLQVIPGADHSLNAELVNTPDGEGLNDGLRQLVLEVASR